jgi:phosphoribosylglycinamide formyltransferase-1
VIRWAVFVSGEGTNLQNILDGKKEGLWPQQEVVWVHASRECPAVARAKSSHREVWIRSPRAENYISELCEELRRKQIDRIFLLGYMSILPSSFFSGWAGPCINLHPSLLPKYKGLHAAERAFESEDPELGVSLHEVVEDLDSGPLIRQESFLRSDFESFDDYKRRIHEAEKKIVRDYLNSLEFRSPPPIV